uniref:C2H2-type domain-containing protein n=1 Tax=Meloidogyne incognita TaxID=6306 RepID=A0A914KZ39_MELIC
MFNQKFNAIVILFFLLKNYSEGGPKERKTRGKGKSGANVDHHENSSNYYEQPNQGSANYSEGDSSSVPALTLVSPTNFSCKWDGCGHVFDNEENFMEHVKAHAKMEKGTHPYCRWSSCNGKKFLRQNFSQHIRMHTGEKLYVCEYCDKKCTRLNTLENHRRSHMGERKIYQCAHCDKTFKSKNGKVGHEKSKHSSDADHKVDKCSPRVMLHKYNTEPRCWVRIP